VLVVGVAQDVVPPWATVEPRAIGRRAAWYSLGFLLRGAASRYLEVQTDELEVGIRAIHGPDGTRAQVFLADSLANGAGYCTHLGLREHFEGLLAEAATWGEWLSDPAMHGCDSGCYDCLKDYRNSAYHGLLDWRLALDLLALLRGAVLDPEQRWAGLADSALAGFAADLQLEVEQIGDTRAVVDRDNARALIAVHPFEHMPPEPLAHDRHALTRSAAEAAGYELRTASLFELVRAPSLAFSRLMQA